MASRKATPEAAFATRVSVWQRREGRHDLPWQNTRDPYRIWLSEVMLQQTQVATVIPYYEKFLARFPTVAELAAAPVDDVMQLWAGLGYYARARNLHRAAQQVAAEHGGKFPADFEGLKTLPGVGRSTAAAIAAFAYGERQPILDGNVRRVFARHFGIEGDVRAKDTEARLWTEAERQVPQENIEAYTQGLMDLGATLCARNEPACLLCPVRETCVAQLEGRTAELPGKRPARETPHRQTRMLVLISSGEVLLEKRPPSGIWGGLWCLPEIPVEDDPMQVLHRRYAVKGRTVGEMDAVQHGFTHYSLTIFPLKIAVSKREPRAMEPGLMWLNLEDAKNAALPAPVKKILLAAR